jgi:hypothetical protein
MTKCGAHAHAGRIFCPNCGAALPSPLPLIRPTLEGYSSPSHAMKPTRSTIVKFILLGFPLSVVLDIVPGIIIPDHVIRPVLVFIVPVLLVGILLVAFGTVTKGQWGIKYKTCEPAALAVVRCPKCGNRNQ